VFQKKSYGHGHGGYTCGVVAPLVLRCEAQVNVGGWWMWADDAVNSKSDHPPGNKSYHLSH